MSKQPQRKQKHVPMRTCVACREKVDKRHLTRIVRTQADAETGLSDGVVVDSTGKRNGRGAYLCDKPACWERAVKRRVLDSALKTELTDAEREQLLSVSAEKQTMLAAQQTVSSTATTHV